MTRLVRLSNASPAKKAGVEDGGNILSRKAFLDMLAWSEGTDNGRQKTRNHGYDVIVGVSYLLITPITLANLSLNPKLKSTGAGRYSFFPVREEFLNGLAWKTSRKVRTLWHCSRLRSVALYLWLIVVISVRQSTVAAISGLHCRALPFWWFNDARLTAWLQNSKKRAERSERLMWAGTRILSLWLSASSSACHGLLIITVITPLPTKPRNKNARELKLANAANSWHADASAWCCCARCKIHEGVSWC